MIRWREDQFLGVIHADGPDGQGSTLCGRALEGDGRPGEPDLVEVTRGKIDCVHCVAIIDHAKKIPARLVRR